MSTAGGRFKELQYDTHQQGQELLVLRRIPSNAPTEDILNDARKRIESVSSRNKQGIFILLRNSVSR